MEYAAFKAASGASFALAGNEPLTLADVSDQVVASGMSSFSLLFRGAVQLEQGMVSLHTADHGTCELFLVPVGLTEGQYEYEAVFTTVEQVGVT